MKNYKVNFKESTIEITNKAFERAASEYGSEAYKELNKVRKDNPGFKVVVIENKRKASPKSIKGLTYERMEKYIVAHDEDGSILTEFKARRAKDGLADVTGKTYSYGSNKAWFLEKFPEIKDYVENLSSHTSVA